MEKIPSPEMSSTTAVEEKLKGERDASLRERERRQFEGERNFRVRVRERERESEGERNFRG